MSELCFSFKSNKFFVFSNFLILLFKIKSVYAYDDIVFTFYYVKIK